MQDQGSKRTNRATPFRVQTNQTLTMEVGEGHCCGKVRMSEGDPRSGGIDLKIKIPSVEDDGGEEVVIVLTAMSVRQVVDLIEDLRIALLRLADENPEWWKVTISREQDTMSDEGLASLLRAIQERSSVIRG